MTGNNKNVAMLIAILIMFVFSAQILHAKNIGYEIRVGIGLSESHPQGLAVMKFANLVESRSGGKIRVRLYAGGALGNDESMVADLKSGKLEMCVPDTATLVSQVKGFGILNFPFLFENEIDADALLDSSFGEKLLNSLQDHNLIGLAFWENGFRNITNNVRPVTRLSDFRDLKIRVINNPLYMDTFMALGATPIPLAFPDVYSGLKAGRIDGQENPLATIKSSKFYEVQRYLTLTRHTYSVWVLLMSKTFWSKLGLEERAIIKAAAIEARGFERTLIRENNKVVLEELRREGMIVSDISALDRSKLRVAAMSVREKYKNLFGKEWSDSMFLGMLENETKKFNTGK